MNNFHRIYFVLIFKMLYWRKMRELRSHFGSKTPYSEVENLNVDEIRSKGFGTPSKIWMVIRHGTRFPSLTQVESMNAKLPVIQKKILRQYKENTSDFEMSLLANVTTKFTECNCNKLTRLGKSEIISLSKRTQKRFSELLNSEYDANIYKFRLTYTDRTLESAQQFAKGLFGESVKNVIKYEVDEKLLRFYKLCTKWRNEIKQNPSSLKEKQLFENTTLSISAVKIFNEKLRLIDSLSFDDIETMYKACIAETSSSKLSAWCMPFSMNVIKVFEYSEDLKYYWLDGYGHEITYKHACPLFKSMIEFLNSDKEYPKAIFNFAHSGALLKMIAHLQLFKDNMPLTHNGFNSLRTRKWCVSKIGGFGSNITFLLFNIEGKHKLLTLHQEKIIRLPCCPNTDLCDFDVVKQYYKSSLEDCNFDEICNPQA